MESLFSDCRITDNGFQDPLGNDAHLGLERFIEAFHKPACPAYTIITDPDYYVFLWFHDANGKLIYCPYLGKEKNLSDNGFNNKVFSSYYYKESNASFDTKRSI